MHWGLRFGLSASMYAGGEVAADWWSHRRSDGRRVARVAVAGATGDALLLSQFHRVVDRRLPSPLARVIGEQLLYAPAADAAYLTLRHGSVGRWTWDEFRDVYAHDLAFWPAASWVGYRFVPLERRFLWVTACSLAWNTIRGSVALPPAGESATRRRSP